MVFDSLLNPILSPILNLPPIVAVAFLAFVIALILTLIQKFATDQARLKEIKGEMKKAQKRIRELQKEDPQKAMQVQKDSMKLTLETMRHSMKSMLYSFIPIIIIFTWMAGNLAFEPINPNQEFDVSVFLENALDNAIVIDLPDSLEVVDTETNAEETVTTWTLRGSAGEHLVEFETDNSRESKIVLITDNQRYADQEKVKPHFTLFGAGEGFLNENSEINKIRIDYQKKIYINIFGGMGWLLTYILFSLIFSIAMRKLLKVH